MALGKNISPGQGETYYRKDDYYLESASHRPEGRIGVRQKHGEGKS